MELTKSGLISRLKKEKAKIIFIKADGTERIMECTLMKSFLPEQIDIEEYVSERNTNEDVIAVWDLEKKDWRSFRLDRVESIIWY